MCNFVANKTSAEKKSAILKYWDLIVCKQWLCVHYKVEVFLLLWTKNVGFTTVAHEAHYQNAMQWKERKEGEAIFWEGLCSM